jgi:hypothetical protein
MESLMATVKKQRTLRRIDLTFNNGEVSKKEDRSAKSLSFEAEILNQLFEAIAIYNPTLAATFMTQFFTGLRYSDASELMVADFINPDGEWKKEVALYPVKVYNKHLD